MARPTTSDEYLRALPADQRRALSKLRDQIKTVVPEAEEYVALGAARQAAWALAGTAEPPPWPQRSTETYTGAEQPQIRERHAALRDDTVTWDERTTP